MIKTITLIGSSSGRNAGDAALVAGIMQSIDKACGRRLRYEIPTYRPDFVRQSYQNDAHAASMLPWHGSVGMFGIPSYLAMLKSDLILIYDNMLFDRALYNPLFNFMPAAKFLAREAKKRGKLVGLYNIGAGPVSTPRGKEMLREIAEMSDFITVRDYDSEKLLREIGVKNQSLLVTADAALGLQPASAERIEEIMKVTGLSVEKTILAINVNAYLDTWSEDKKEPLTKEKFASIYAAALDQVTDKTGAALLFVCTQHHDVTVTRMVMDAVKSPVKKALISNIEYSPWEIKGVFKRVSLLFAMRLHASILCTGALTPALSLAFQKKVTSYYGMLGLPENTLPFSQFSTENLARHILDGWQRRDSIRQTLERRIPELVIQADKAARMVALLSDGTSSEQSLKICSNDSIK